ncbi:MAG: hypothetical protein K5849_06200 [Bacteroidales bacterium]|nr:hypothetical protein [Bacteroidales bacterium]
MKKILEIYQYGECDLRFNSDLEPSLHPEMVVNLVSLFSGSMMTSLWGGNEQDILAIIRALAIADLAVSVNRKEMIKELDRHSEKFAGLIYKARREMEQKGGVFFVPVPGMTKPKN